MKSGAYVTFRYDGKTYKGRVAIENGNTFICQDLYSASTLNGNQYGHEFAWNMGNGSVLKDNIISYAIKQVTKEQYDAHKDPLVKQVFGYNVHKRPGGIVEFGCGAVTLNVKQIQEFIGNYDEYRKIIKKRDELQKKLNEESKVVNEWLAKHPGLNTVIASVRGRGHKVENVNIEKLRRLFPARKAKKA